MLYINKIKSLLLVFTLSICCFFKSTLLAQSPGQISSNAAVLDVDKLSNFQDGAAIVTKGISVALINEKGIIIVPFNKYVSLKHGKSGSNIIIALKETENGNRKYGLLNTKGKEILPFIYRSLNINFDADGYVLVGATPENQSTFFLSSEGTKYIIPARLSSQFPLINEKICSEGLCPIRDKNGKSGYADHTGKIVISPQFDEVNFFTDSMACIGNKNEFGEIKYGFINRQDKFVIPPKYSIKPSVFSSGLAMVFPTDKKEFKYAYIDKKGNISFKVKNLPDGRELYLANDFNPIFVNGYSEWMVYTKSKQEIFIMDTSGNFINEKDYLAKLGVNVNELSTIRFALNLSSAKNYFVQIRGNSSVNNCGFVNMKTGKVLPMIFNIDGEDTFDPISRLVLSSHMDDKKNKKNIEGYINEDGIYVIIKKQKDLW